MKKQIMIRGIVVGGIVLGLGGTTFAAAKQAQPKLNSYAITLEAGTSQEDLLKELKKDSQGVDSITLSSRNYEKSQLGTQEVEVTLKNNKNQERHANVQIKIIDTTPPTISSESSYTVNIDQPFDLKNEITVTDNSSATPTVTISNNTKKVGKEAVSIVAVDASNNISKKEVTLDYVDTTSPIIIGEDLTVTQGETIDLLQGVTATDNADGDLTKEITTTGTANTNVVGTYPIRYSLQDTSGNSTTFTRNIHVIASATPQSTSTTEAGISFVSNTQSQPMTMTVGGVTLSYQNGGQAAGQSIIDANPNNVISTWGGAAIQSSTDGMNTHFIGHNPGAFNVLFNLSGGSIITMTDANGTSANYSVSSIFQVNDEAIGISDGVSYWDTITGTGGGERITLQTCINDSVNLIVIAYLV